MKLEDMRESVLISSNLGQHVAWLAEYIDLGAAELQLHRVARSQQAFIEAFGEKVLPSLS